MPGYANPFDPATSPGADAPGGLPGDYYLNYDPEAGFWRYLRDNGLGGNNRQSNYAQQQYTRTYGNYRAIAADDPNMGFYDYLRANRPNFEQEYMNQSPEQRGDYSSRILTPRARWANG